VYGDKLEKKYWKPDLGTDPIFVYRARKIMKTKNIRFVAEVRS
jgi:hypothetical protein